MNNVARVTDVLAQHVLLSGNGYHRTRRCTCGWSTRDADPASTHRSHVAEQVLEVLA